MSEFVGKLQDPLLGECHECVTFLNLSNLHGPVLPDKGHLALMLDYRVGLAQVLDKPLQDMQTLRGHTQVDFGCLNAKNGPCPCIAAIPGHR